MSTPFSPWIIPLLIILLPILTKLISKIFLKSFSKQKLPPGPPKLPIIGNLHQLASKTTPPPQRLQELAQIYGPIMHLRIGEVPTIVISSAEVAKDILRTHDTNFANRPELLAAKVLYYACTDIGLAPYGEYWRQVRKIATVELFTVKRVKSFGAMREEEVCRFVEGIALECKVGGCVNLSELVFGLLFNLTSSLSIQVMENWCRVVVKDEEEQESNLFIQSYVNARRISLSWYDKVHSYEDYGPRNKPRNEVLNCEELITKIFDQLEPNSADRFNMARVCRYWAKLFLIHPESPGVLLAYVKSLVYNDINGVRILRCNGKVISKRCKCCMTNDDNVKFLLHFKQRYNIHQREHLNPLDDNQNQQVEERQRNMPEEIKQEAQLIADYLLARRTYHYVENIDLTGDD